MCKYVVHICMCVACVHVCVNTFICVFMCSVWMSERESYSMSMFRSEHIYLYI